MSVKISNDEIQTLAIFEKATGTYARDCIRDGESIYFIVENGKMGTAIGKGGVNVKRVREILRKEVKIFEYSPSPQEMIKKMIPTAKTVEIIGGDAVISVAANDRSAVIGKGGKNIKVIKEILNRHFDIKNLRLK
jgi:transcription termination/antitermination protein NusA